MPAEYEPTAEQRALVESASAIGITQAEIANQLKIDEKTLRKHFRGELSSGKFKVYPRAAHCCTKATYARTARNRCWRPGSHIPMTRARPEAALTKAFYWERRPGGICQDRYWRCFPRYYGELQQPGQRVGERTMAYSAEISRDAKHQTATCAVVDHAYKRGGEVLSKRRLAIIFLSIAPIAPRIASRGLNDRDQVDREPRF
jgi:hypothetical protein